MAVKPTRSTDVPADHAPSDMAATPAPVPAQKPKLTPQVGESFPQSVQLQSGQKKQIVARVIKTRKNRE